MGINTFNGREKTKALVIEDVIGGTPRLPWCSNLSNIVTVWDLPW